ncbi:hypothetical protein A4G20_09205 [Pasteurellaceae bacterium RH1A]|nr:hypothetical protein A4G20_09205 [Pasteurellaceae bacterium RH1A]
MSQPAMLARSAKASFSLVEVLISLSLSLVLLFVAGSFYAQHYAAQEKQAELLRLQARSHQMINYFRQHIENINFMAYRKYGKYNLDFFKLKNKTYYLAPNQSCLMFVYDLNSDGCIGEMADTSRRSCLDSTESINAATNLTREIFGFKLENQEIYIYSEKSREAKCKGAECARKLQSCDNKWDQLTFKADLIVDELKFDLDERKGFMKIKYQAHSPKDREIAYGLETKIHILNWGRE